MNVIYILRKNEREYYDLLKINKYNLAKSWKIIEGVRIKTRSSPFQVKLR